MVKQQIIDRVKINMEEVSPFDDGLAISNSEVKPIASYIEGSIQACMDRILMLCPLQLTISKALPTTNALTSELSYAKEIGTLTLPDDFLRLHTFKMKNWEKKVQQTISVEHPAYELQQNRWTRGGNSKPVIVKDNGKLEIYSYDTGDEVEVALYVARIELYQLIDMNEKLFEPLCAMITADVYAIFGSKASEYWQQKADNLLKLEL